MMDQETVMATEAIGSATEATGIKEEGKPTFSSPVGMRGGVCPLCKKEVKKDLKEHIKRVHLSKDDVMCELCGKTMTKHRLQNHIMHVHEQIRDKICDICGFKSYSNPELKLHIQRVHEGVKKERKWPCPYCEYIARSKIIRDNHVKAVHEKTRDMRCPLCEEIFVTINHLNKHIRDFHLDLQRDKCAECGFVGNTARELISHLRDAHGIRKTCPKCGFVEKKTYRLSRHFAEAHPEAERIKCNMCGFMTIDPAVLKRHVSTVHDCNKIGPKCPVCEYQARNVMYLTRHVREAHDKWNPFKCPKCAFRSPNGQELSAHMKEKHENPEEEAAQAVLEKINEVSKDNKKRWTAQRRRPLSTHAPPCTCKKPGCREMAPKTDPDQFDPDQIEPDWEMSEPSMLPPPPPAEGGRYRQPPCTCKKSGSVRRRGRPRSNAGWSEDFEEDHTRVAPKAVPRPRPKRHVATPQTKSLASRLRDIPGLQIMKVPDASQGRPRRGVGRAYYKEEDGDDDDDDDDGDYDYDGVGMDPLDSVEEDENEPSVLEVAVECALKEEPGENGDTRDLQTVSASRIAAAASQLPDIPAESVFREEASKSDRLVACMAMLRNFLGERGIAGYDLTVLKRFEALVKTNISKSGLANGDKERLAENGGAIDKLPENTSECDQNGTVEIQQSETMPSAEEMDGVEVGSRDETHYGDADANGRSKPGGAGGTSEYVV